MAASTSFDLKVLSTGDTNRMQRPSTVRLITAYRGFLSPALRVEPNPGLESDHFWPGRGEFASACQGIGNPKSSIWSRGASRPALTASPRPPAPSVTHIRQSGPYIRQSRPYIRQSRPHTRQSRPDKTVKTTYKTVKTISASADRFPSSACTEQDSQEIDKTVQTRFWTYIRQSRNI